MAREKSAVPTPVTASENITVQCTLEALVGFASVRLMEDTVGFVLSTVYTCPVKLPLPVPPEPAVPVPVPPCLPARRSFEPSSFRFRPRDPLPDPVEAVTV